MAAPQISGCPAAGCFDAVEDMESTGAAPVPSRSRGSGNSVLMEALGKGVPDYVQRRDLALLSLAESGPWNVVPEQRSLAVESAPSSSIQQIADVGDRDAGIENVVDAALANAASTELAVLIDSGCPLVAQPLTPAAESDTRPSPGASSVDVANLKVQQPPRSDCLAPAAVRHGRGAPVTRTAFQRVRESHIGRGASTDTPFGVKIMVYADYAASGRLLQPIEDYMQEHVYPYYANVHSDTGVCATVSAAHVSAARSYVATALAAPQKDYACIFTGSGVTGAISKLAHLLGIERRARGRGWRRPVVLVSIMEHHSNCVLWRELDCEVVVIPVNVKGRLDLKVLKAQLRAHANAPLILGSFSAGSNVTGTTPGDLRAIARLLHRHGALAAFDCASAFCCSAIECHPPGCPDTDAFDAVYLSPHKLPGGPGACGVLVVRRSAVRQRTPQIAGGGTVQFVDGKEHCFLDSIEAREEGGTPNIIGCIRAGLALRLHSDLDPHRIHRAGLQAVRRAMAAWSSEPGIHIVGSHYAAARASDRMSLISFNISTPAIGELRIRGMKRALLHAHFVAAVLNDVFGIQARAECSCAGPWGIELLRGMMTKMGAWDIDAMKEVVVGGCEWPKTGWVRVNFNHVMSDEEVNYIIDAVLSIACYGPRLLPQYNFCPQTGLFSYRRDVDHGSNVNTALSRLFDQLTAEEQRPGLTQLARGADKAKANPASRQRTVRTSTLRAFGARLHGLTRTLRCAVDSDLAVCPEAESPLSSLPEKAPEEDSHCEATFPDEVGSDSALARALAQQQDAARNIFARALENTDALHAACQWPRDDAAYRQCVEHRLRAFLLPHEAAAEMLSLTTRSQAAS